MKYLLIDDLAEKGWGSILNKAVIKNSGALILATSFDDAIEKLKTPFNIIFLDVRLTELDHKVDDVKDYSGFKILNNIRSEFSNINFCTPIILITASNKIWNIDAFREYGVDSYYIKEHPDTVFNKQISKINLKNLQNDFIKFLDEGKRRKEVWTLSTEIIENLEKHQYFKSQDKRYINIKNRIIDKLKIAYSLLFKKQNQIEKDILLSNNDSLSFVVFFSILEEISKGYTDFSNTWDQKYNRKGNWKFRNGIFFIESSDDGYKINYDSKSKQKNSTSVDERYYNGMINLSEQIYSLIYAFAPKEMIALLKEEYRELNQNRNITDYIHSSLFDIFTQNLISENSMQSNYKMNLKILYFINELLKFPDEKY